VDVNVELCLMLTNLPNPPFQPAYSTTPSPTVTTGVPYLAA
jgi:hypothetical protein